MAEFQSGLLEPSEIDELLRLQKRNMKNEISLETAQSQGFLTFAYSHDLIKAMMDDMAQPIARANGELAGYALATSRNVGLSNELLAPAVHLIDTLTIDGKPIDANRYYIMGQICVSEINRGIGIFDALYQHHKNLFSHQFDYLLTEISQLNARSLAAHQRVGFKIIHSYNDGETDWQIVAWDWR